MASGPLVVMIHSPLVGAMTWQRSADVLRAAAHAVIVPSLVGAMGTGPPFYAKLAHRVVQVVREVRPVGPVALVAHSGAGSLIPAIVEELAGPVCAAVFVDAILPHPGASWFDTAPADLGGRLRGLARDGLLPPWHQWFPPEAIATVLPDEDLRTKFVAELPRLPLAYLEERAPVVAAWPSIDCGYLRLSAAYEETAVEAERQGWLTVRVPASHLAMITRPEETSAALERVLDSIARRSHP